MRELTESVKKVNDALRKNGVYPDSVGKNKDGTVTVRKGFFYTHGKDSSHHTKNVIDALNKAGVKHTVVDDGEHRAARWRGGASVRQGDHWYTTVKLHEGAINEECLEEAAGHGQIRAHLEKLGYKVTETEKTANHRKLWLSHPTHDHSMRELHNHMSSIGVSRLHQEKDYGSLGHIAASLTGKVHKHEFEISKHGPKNLFVRTSSTDAGRENIRAGLDEAYQSPYQRAHDDIKKLGMPKHYQQVARDMLRAQNSGNVDDHDAFHQRHFGAHHVAVHKILQNHGILDPQDTPYRSKAMYGDLQKESFGGTDAADYQSEYKHGLQIALRLKLISADEIATMTAAGNRIRSGKGTRKDYDLWNVTFGKVWDILTNNPTVQSSIRQAMQQKPVAEEAAVDKVAADHKKAVKKAESRTTLVHLNGYVVRIPKHKTHEYLAKGYQLAEESSEFEEEVLPGEGEGWHAKKAKKKPTVTRVPPGHRVSHLRPAKDVSHLSLESKILKAVQAILAEQPTAKTTK